MAASKAGFRSVNDTSFVISGVLDFDSVPVLMREIKPKLEKQPIANISFFNVGSCNSAGLALILEMTRLMQGKKIQFTNIPDQLYAMAKAYGVADELKRLGLINT